MFLVCCLYNLNHYYETEHMEKYKNLTDAEQEWISECLLAKLQKKQGVFYLPSFAHPRTEQSRPALQLPIKSQRTGSYSLMGSLSKSVW